ncbi:MAG: response regulator transcription factor [Sedimentisphaerales bacterium]|nr:response regulator transcription factor [Sedimentisphaerales bacterium]
MSQYEKSSWGEKRARIFIIDDHPIVREGLTRLIATKAGGDLTVCGEAEEAAAAIQEIAKVRPDLAIVDISLRGYDGIELTKNLKNQFPSMPVLILSMHDEQLYAERSLQAGAHGYIMKNESPDLLLTAIRKILSGQVYVSESVSRRILQRIQREGADALSTAVDSLADRELEVFHHLGHGLTTRQIADRLCISVKTVETHMARIKAKLDVQTFNELIVRAVLWANDQHSN